MTELVVRLVFSLAVVLGLLLLCARLASRRFRGGKDALVTVLHRQAIGRNAAVSVVCVGGRTLVLGVTDHEMRLLTELDPHELDPRELDDSADLGDQSVEPALSLVPDPVEVLLQAETATRPAPHVTYRAVSRTASRPASRSGSHRAGPATQGGLTGSVLSPRTWRQAWGAVSRRAS